MSNPILDTGFTFNPEVRYPMRYYLSVILRNVPLPRLNLSYSSKEMMIGIFTAFFLCREI
ncbi:hypothetical protein NHE_0589 [Neorickettsia helminthoeca str. Oregon]|uniref:Uncharacterized protein n=1 Tax=Neorickettsia helminthoeca str. Oregon TaxID=1286528 RepID=X5GWY5_9RICK|nr:hypothetical protein NHE_0589 [Neorickettsia helminthoeca str. Oregon]